MGRGVVYLSLWIATTLCVSGSFGSEKNVQGVIAKVVDGDTLWVAPKGGTANGAAVKPKTLKIRMIGIDAPESHLPTTGGVASQSPWGDEAATELADLSPVGKNVTVESFGEDKYQRTLGRVLVGSTDINLEMIRSGWAIPYIICEGANCKKGFFEDQHVEEYLTACEEARSKKLGVWNPKEPLKEMPFEFRLRMQGRTPEKFVGNYETSEYVAPEDYKEIDVCNRIFFMKESDAKKIGYTAARKGPADSGTEFN